MWLRNEGEIMQVTIGLALVAGLASFLSPCVFSLVPVYISYLSGRSFAATDTDIPYNRWNSFLHGVAFVLGFSIVFITMGVAVSALGGYLYNLRYWLAKIGGILVVIFGLHMTGILRIPFLYYDLRPRTKTDQQRSYFSSTLMGVFFSAGWSPCIGPVLGAILTIAMNGGSISTGIKLLTAYSAGLAIPFLLTALGIDYLTGWLKKFRKVTHYVEIGMGVLLIIIGALLFLGIFEQLARFGNGINLGL
jgi:cytochrome c-type biogenesis protein